MQCQLQFAADNITLWAFFTDSIHQWDTSAEAIYGSAFKADKLRVNPRSDEKDNIRRGAAPTAAAATGYTVTDRIMNAAESHQI